MGGKSKSKSKSQSNTVNTGALVNQGAQQQANNMNGAVQHQADLRDSQLGTIFPAFGEMVQGGMGLFGSNPIANLVGGMMGMPINLETPDFAQAFIDKYKKPEEQAQLPDEQMPQVYNVNDDMRQRLMGVKPYGQSRYGIIGGVRK